MSKKLDTPKAHVFYIRLSSYYASYIKTRYGSPAILPSMVPISQYMYRYLVNNPLMAQITPFCYSEAAFNYNDKNSLFRINAHRPLAEDRSEFVPIVINPDVMSPTDQVINSSTWQLSSTGAILFRKQLKKDFWVQFSKFYDECLLRSRRIGEVSTFEEITSDFMVIYNINMKEYENMKRYWYRHISKMEDEVENNRKWLEEHTGNVFHYTV